MLRLLGRAGLRASMMGLRAGIRSVAPGTRFTFRSFLRTFIPGIPGDSGMIKLTVKTKGFESLLRTLKTEPERQRRALEYVLRREGYNLSKELKKCIDQGRPGGSARWPSLTFLSRGLGIRTGRRLRKDRPLIRLKSFVRYNYTQNPFQVRVGFVGPRVPKMIKELAKKQQEGFTMPISKKMRRLIIREGARRGAIEGGTTPFFLEKSTRAFRTPARPIIDPFWKANKDKAWRNIRRNYRLKAKGLRI